MTQREELFWIAKELKWAHLGAQHHTGLVATAIGLLRAVRQGKSDDTVDHVLWEKFRRYVDAHAAVMQATKEFFD